MADLDLSTLTSEAITVKLPDGNEYAMTNPMDMTAYQFHVFFSRKDEVDSQFNKEEDWTDEDAKEMMRILVDLCQAVLPNAPRESLEDLSFNNQLTLVDRFSQQAKESMQQNGEGDGDPKAVANHSD